MFAGIGPSATDPVNENAIRAQWAAIAVAIDPRNVWAVPAPSDSRTSHRSCPRLRRPCALPCTASDRTCTDRTMTRTLRTTPRTDRTRTTVQKHRSWHTEPRNHVAHRHRAAASGAGLRRPADVRRHRIPAHFPRRGARLAAADLGLPPHRGTACCHGQRHGREAHHHGIGGLGPPHRHHGHDHRHRRPEHRRSLPGRHGADAPDTATIGIPGVSWLSLGSFAIGGTSIPATLQSSGLLSPADVWIGTTLLIEGQSHKTPIPIRIERDPTGVLMVSLNTSAVALPSINDVLATFGGGRAPSSSPPRSTTWPASRSRSCMSGSTRVGRRCARSASRSANRRPTGPRAG